MSYLGRSAKLSRKTQEKTSFLATAGQTVATGLSYVATFVEVHVNGILLTDTSDYTATNGNSITFTVALSLNDEVTVISLKTFALADHYSKAESDAAYEPIDSAYTKAEADTLLAAKANTANFTSTGIDDNATSTAITIDASENLWVGSADGTNSIIRLINGVVNDEHYLISYTNGHMALKNNITAGDLYFHTGNVERMRVYAAGDVKVTTGNLVIGTSGKGIDFSTDGDASGMTSELLDDYEEGTFIASIRDAATGSNSQLLSVNATATAMYTKIGRLVHYTIVANNISTAGLTASSRAFITGFPFTVSLENVASLWHQNFTFSGSTSIVARMATSEAVYFDEMRSGTTDNVIRVSHITNGAADFRLTGTYMTSQ